jgi:TRAP-type uncharacterized transport system substrate-binding protein
MTFDIQAGGSNHHYGRIAHWLAVNIWRHFPQATLNVKIGSAFRDLTAVGDGLAHIGVFTPAQAARLALEGRATFDRPRPALRAIGVVPHRDALVAGVARELGLRSLDELAEQRTPLRLAVPPAEHLTGHASRHILALHGITPKALESWGGRWIEAGSAQAAWKMVAAGEAHGMINESIPQAFRPLSRQRPIRLLGFRRDAADELETTVGYRWRLVEAGTIAGQEEPVIGLSWDHWIVVAHHQLPDEIAYALADAFLNDTHALERQYTADGRLGPDDCSLEAPLRPEVVSNEVTIELHPGARRRYEEAGVLAAPPKLGAVPA